MNKLDKIDEIREKKVYQIRSVPPKKYVLVRPINVTYFDVETQTLEYPYQVYKEKIKEKLENDKWELLSIVIYPLGGLFLFGVMHYIPNWIRHAMTHFTERLTLYFQNSVDISILTSNPVKMYGLVTEMIRLDVGQLSLYYGPSTLRAGIVFLQKY